MEATSKKRPVHVGRNIQKYRLFRGYSQAGLAHQLETRLKRSVSQQLVSDIEDREIIQDEEVLSAIAEILDVPSEVLKELDLDTAISIIGTSFTNHPHSHPVNQLGIFNGQTINQYDSWEKERDELNARIKKLEEENNGLKGNSRNKG